MTAAIIIAMLVGHQPDIPITYQGPTARLSEVMSEVGRQAGATIKVVGAPERDFVYLNVTNRPLSKVLDLVATGTESKWRVTAPGQIEISAPWNPDAPTKHDRDVISQWLRENPAPGPFTRLDADRYVEDGLALLALKPGSERDRQNAFMSDRTPIARAIVATLHALGPARLAAVTAKPQQFRIHPVGQAQALPQAARAAFSKVPGQHYALHEALARKGINLVEPRIGQDSIPTVWQPAAPSSQGDAYDWKVTIRRGGSGLQIEAYRLTEDGTYQGPFESYTLSMREPQEFRGDFSVIPNDPFQWTPETLAILRPVGQRNTSSTLSKAAIDRLTRCADEEVFTTGLEPAFEVWAKKSGRDIFAVVPDRVFDSLEDNIREANQAGRQISFAYMIDGRLLEVGNAYVLTGTLAEMRRSRIARPEAQRLFREIAGAGFTSLSTLADLYAAAPYESAYHEATGKAASFREPRVWMPHHAPMIAIYASLTDRQKEAAARGGLTIPYSAMSLGQRQAVEMMIDNPSTRIRPQNRDRKFDSDASDPQAIDNTLRSNLKLHIKHTAQQTIFESSLDKGGYRAELNASNIPYKKPAWFETARFTVNKVDLVEVTIEIPQVGQTSGKIELRQQPAQEALLKYNQLPQSFLDEAEKLLKERERALEEARKHPINTTNAARSPLHAPRTDVRSNRNSTPFNRNPSTAK